MISMMGSAHDASFSAHERAQALTRLPEREFDLIVIGGGITGAGVARDAASRGMSVALIEAQDFAQGTSSRSSKLIHGGLRYLENLEFHLVFESLAERRLLFEIAPHLVHPLRFVLPLYEGGRVGMFKMGMGMWLYDALSLFEAPEMHERLSAAKTIGRLPLLREQGLMGSYVYSDAYMDDDRLVLETLRAASRLGALCVSFCAATGAELDGAGRVRAVRCSNRGPADASGRAPRDFVVRARHVVSTVGPWTDILADGWFTGWRRLLRPSKGIHLTFERKRLQLNQAVVMTADAEKRLVFGIPRHEMIVVGTTDTDYPGDPADVTATPDDVRYLLDVAGQYFPGAKLTAGDVVSSYAGVRPLVEDGARSEGKTSREHVILEDPRNVTFVAGGKYTTYRRMAEDAVRSALKSFPVEDRIRFLRSDTQVPLNPKATTSLMEQADREAGLWSKEFALGRGSVEWLIGRHGYEALDLLRSEPSSERGTRDPHEDGARRAARERWRLTAMEARHAIRTAMCLRLVDFYARRSPLFLADRDHGLPFLQALGALFADELGWGDARRREEEDAVRRLVRHELAWKSAFGMAPGQY